jgi:anhydro-N-acetylmuramic acid kinase
MNLPLLKNTSCVAIGLMSGTSIDGIDAVAVKLTGCGTNTKVQQLGFVTVPFSDEAHNHIMAVAGGECINSRELCLLNFYFGSLLADACETVCRESGLKPADIDFVGSHGQTVWHEPKPVPYLGSKVRATLQLGEASVIAERLGCPVVSDFRVRDMAAGGLGAPLVPYTEYLLYRDGARNVALQNIGGISNITLLPAGGVLTDTLAFDTGPGNMIMDALTIHMTGGKAHYDDGGRLASAGNVSKTLLEYLIDNDTYLRLSPPKTTGREYYGTAFVDALQAKGHALGLSDTDILATATRYTAESIRIAVENFCPVRPDRLIVGGGGSRNPVLMGNIANALPGCEVLTNEDLGLDSDSKEAVAFAVLANETLHGQCNNAPSATGAIHPVVMGKITI